MVCLCLRVMRSRVFLCYVAYLDVRNRVANIRWTKSKDLAAVLLMIRTALNFFSVIVNVVELPTRDTTLHYDLAKRIVFIFELCSVGVFALLCLGNFLAAYVTRWTFDSRFANKVDPTTNQPFDTTYRRNRKEVRGEDCM